MSIGIIPVYSQTSIGVIGGYNSTTIYPKQHLDALRYSVSATSGWRAGLIADQHLGGKFYLQPQLILNQKGFDYSAALAPTYFETQRHLLYMELQANMVFKQQIGKGKLFVGAGHYIGRGIAGREKTKGYYEQGGVGYNYTEYHIVKYRSKFPESNPNSYELNVTNVRPYDIGINFLAGYELKNGLFFNANYSTGLFDVGYYDKAISNFYVGLSVGFFLKRFS
jgi:hypothetical protein